MGQIYRIRALGLKATLFYTTAVFGVSSFLSLQSTQCSMPPHFNHNEQVRDKESYKLIKKSYNRLIEDIHIGVFGLSTWELPLASMTNGLKDVYKKRVQNCEGTQRMITWKKNGLRSKKNYTTYSLFELERGHEVLDELNSLGPSLHSYDLCLVVYVMSSEADFAEFSALFERMIRRGDGLSQFLPLILALAGEAEEDGDSTDQTARHREIVIDDPVNRRVVMIRSALGGFLNGDFSEKQGRSPASKSSVESMPRVVIGKDEERGGSCPICLEEWSEGDVAAEMPCKHEFHSKCAEEWLGRHATCPLCRYEMPVEEVEEEKKVGVWIGFAVSAGERRNEEEGGRRSDGDSNTRDEAEA
ncbi:hypothetical protein Bca4012_038023 [Brassica carinata]